jgi:hypothetical protein
MRLAATLLVTAAMLLALSDQSVAQPTERAGTVDCVWPGETLQGALDSLAQQTGFTVDLGGNEDEIDLTDTVYVLARKVDAREACLYLSSSSALDISLDHASKTIRVRDYEEGPRGVGVARLYDTAALCRAHTSYLNRYGREGDPLIEAPSPAKTLLELVHMMLDGAGVTTQPGSAIGNRLLLTREAVDHARIGELLKLLGSEGESASLKRDRENREHLASRALNRQFTDEPVSVVLYALFEGCKAPVVIERSMLDYIDLLGETSSIKVTDNCLGGLQKLASEQGFEFDEYHGAIRLHCHEYTTTDSYRVFDVSALLAKLEKQYDEMRSQPGVEDGYKGSLRSEGGSDVIVEAVYLQLVMQDLEPAIFNFADKLVVAGNTLTVQRAAELLELLAAGTPEGDKGK